MFAFFLSQLKVYSHIYFTCVSFSLFLLQLLSRVLITSFSLSFLRTFKNYGAFSLIKE
ncbi:hypothetical protein ACJIZ3_003256 [Penstemon smallii]|uniref:Uncharacterized protein n=1 Tax=Penstemon smallii TaxID=265156 RepID=A0ABD3UCH3_9LAMI